MACVASLTHNCFGPKPGFGGTLHTEPRRQTPQAAELAAPGKGNRGEIITQSVQQRDE